MGFSVGERADDASTLSAKIVGPRFELELGDAHFPASLASVPHAPKKLYGLGDVEALDEGLAVVGARRATPYGLGCAKRFASLAAERGVTIISGGARGCDAAAHEAALSAGGRTAVVLGGGIDEPYPAEHVGLFQRVVNAGGVLLSEHDWGVPPLPYAFRERNRIISGLARAVLIVEAGLPSGTFSTADAALSQGREVWVVPGSITSANSRGANRLLYQGAHPIVDDESFEDALFAQFGCLKQEVAGGGLPDSKRAAQTALECPAARKIVGKRMHEELTAALLAESLGMEQLLSLVASKGAGEGALSRLMLWLAEMQKAHVITQYPDGRFGPIVPTR